MELLMIIFKCLVLLCFLLGTVWSLGLLSGGARNWRTFKGPFFALGAGLFLLLFCTLSRPALLAQSTKSASPNATVWRVIDGDTAALDGIIFRIPDMDSPESTWRAKCPAERALGKQASAYAQTLFEGATTHAPASPAPLKTDRYGRSLSDILLGGESFRALMIAAGYARAWDYGKEPKPDWCAG
ncbi:MAG: thermonuclease family protein [Alphaproteobacteria bacterium]